MSKNSFGFPSPECPSVRRKLKWRTCKTCGATHIGFGTNTWRWMKSELGVQCSHIISPKFGGSWTWPCSMFKIFPVLFFKRHVKNNFWLANLKEFCQYGVKFFSKLIYLNSVAMKCFQMLLFIEKAFIFVLLWPVSRFTAQQPHQSHTNNKSAEPATKLKFRKSEISSISVCLLFNLWGFEWNSTHCQMIVRSRNTNSLNYASILIQQQARPHQRGERLTGTFSIFVFFKPAFSLKAPSEMDGNRGDWSRAINYTAMWFHVIIKCVLSIWHWLCFTCLRKFKKCILLKAQKV